MKIENGLNPGEATMKKIIFSILILASSVCFCQTAKGPIVIGDIIEFDSKILNEQRDIYIYTPFGYAQSQEKYPVLFAPIE